jgi:hypothetical protein
MKLLLVSLVFFISSIWIEPVSILGNSKAKLRASMQNSFNKDLKVSEGANSDTIYIRQVMKSILYYKNDTCYSFKDIFPYSSKKSLIDYLKKESYKMINENFWVSSDQTERVEITNFDSLNISEQFSLIKKPK